MADKKINTDNFDKEFSLNKKQKTARRGKLPSWLMILAGAAVITSVVALKQPSVRKPEEGVRASVNLPAQTLVVDTAGYNGMNDSQADSSELEARFVSQTNPFSEKFEFPVYSSGADQVYTVEMEELPMDDSGSPVQDENKDADAAIYWLDEKPYALTLQTDSEPVKAVSSDEGAVYTIGDQQYTLRLESVAAEDLAALQKDEQAKLVNVGGQTYQMQLEPVEKAAAETGAQPEETAMVPDENPFEDNVIPEVTDEADPAAPGKEADKPALAWLNDTPYAVTVKPVTADGSGTSESNPKPTALPVKVIDADGNETPAKVPARQTSVFEVEGQSYEIQLTEMDPETAAADADSTDVIWVDETPLRVSLTSETSGESESPLEIVLNPVSSDELPALLTEKFGDSAVLPEAPTEVPVIIETIVVPTEEPEDEGWFVGLFHNIFGGSPTTEPTPQVTIIAMTATPGPAQPTQTPIVVRIAPTATPQSPVRLDGEGGSSETEDSDLIAKEAESGSVYMYDPALWEVDETAEPTIPADDSTGSVAVTSAPEDSGGQSPEHLDVLIIDPEDPDEIREKPTAQPTPEELPHTGMAEGWNIPYMLALLAGLLLVIIGVRRLRTGRE